MKRRCNSSAQAWYNFTASSRVGGHELKKQLFLEEIESLTTDSIRTRSVLVDLIVA